MFAEAGCKWVENPFVKGIPCMLPEPPHLDVDYDSILVIWDLSSKSPLITTVSSSVSIQTQ